MENYGQTIKKIRYQKRALMKEVYSDILGRTTAYRFEQGNTNISTEKLIKILTALGIYSMDEFLYLHQRTVGILPSSIDKVLTLIMHREGIDIKSNKRQSVLDFYFQYKESKMREDIFYAYVAHLDYLLNKAPMVTTVPKLPKEFQHEYQFIESYLLSIENWTLRELDLFPFLSSCFNDEARPILMDRFKKSYLRYKDYYEEWESWYVNNLLNYAMNSMFLKKYNDLLKNTAEIEQLFSNYPKLHWQLLHKCRLLFLQALCGAYQKKPLDVQTAFQQLQNISNVLPKNSELMDFYLSYTPQMVNELFPEFQFNP